METMLANLHISNEVLMMVMVGVVVFVAIFALLAVGVSLMNYQETPVRDRLLMLKDKAAYEQMKGKGRRGPFDDLKTVIFTWAQPISKALYGENLKYHQQVKTLLTEAGLPDGESHITEFLVRRAATGLVVGAIGFCIMFVTGGGNLFMGFVGLLGGFMVGSMIPQMQLRGQAGKRKTEMRYTMPDMLDLMIVCMEAGLALDSTIQRVAEETEHMAPEISYELKRVNKELNAGISRTEAFQNMGTRSGVDELRSLCAMIVQSDKMGTSISDTLRVFADDLRTKRRQRAEELASKASIKMTFPLVFFIFPPLFIILMGPMVIQAIQQFFPAG